MTLGKETWKSFLLINFAFFNNTANSITTQSRVDVKRNIIFCHFTLNINNNKKKTFLVKKK